MKKEKSFRTWSKIGAIFITYLGLEHGYIICRDTVTRNILKNGVFYYDIVTFLLLLGAFLTAALPYILPIIPLWYYGFKKKSR